MGTWGPGVFEDDVALDVRDQFESALASTGSLIAATEQMLADFEEALTDSDDGPVIYLALATLQLDYGILQPAIRDQTLGIIASGAGLERWEEAGPQELAARRKVLGELRARIAGP